jgi:hypothetical protein
METTKRTIILLILVLLTVAPAQSAEKPATEISNTRKASCLVKLTSDPAVLPVSYETICALLYSSGVGGKAAREILGISPDQISDVFTIDVLVETTGDIQPGSWPMGRSMPPDFPGEYEYEMMMEKEMMKPMMGPAKTTTDRSRSSRTAGRRPRRPTIRRITTATSLTSAAEQTFFFQLSVFQLPDDAKPAAEEFMNALIDNLRSALLDAFNVYRNKLRGQLDLAQEEAARAEHELIRLQKNLREISGGRDLSQNLILRDISRLRLEIENAKMNHASNQLTIDATTKRIAEIQANLKEQIGKDRVTEELQQLFELQFKRLQNTQKLVETGRVSSAELADAEEKLARARIELAKRREELSKSAGGNLIESLNRELADRSIRTAQYEGELSRLERQITEAQELLAKADTYELLSLKVDIAKQNLEETLVWGDRMERRNRLIQTPNVTIIGAD